MNQIDIAIVLVADKRYQKYLDFMLEQIKDSNIKTFCICPPDVECGYAERIWDDSMFGVDVRHYDPNPNMTTAMWKLAIPYIPLLRQFDKVLYLDVDVVLNPGWKTIFQFQQYRPILAAPDVGITAEYLKSINILPFFKGRLVQYANSGVMLFELNRWYTPLLILNQTIGLARRLSWKYIDQDLFNAIGAIQVDLPQEYNRFFFIQKQSKIIHYTSHKEAKKYLEQIIERKRGNAL